MNLGSLISVRNAEDAAVLGSGKRYGENKRAGWHVIREGSKWGFVPFYPFSLGNVWCLDREEGTQKCTSGVFQARYFLSSYNSVNTWQLLSLERVGILP